MVRVRTLLNTLWGRQPATPPLTVAVGRARVHRPRHRHDDTLGQTVPIWTGKAPAPAPWARRRRPVNQRD